MTKTRTFHPAGAHFTGGVIGVAGTSLRVYFKKITPQFRQGIVKVDRVNDTLLFIADRDIEGTIRCEGLHENVGGMNTRLLWTMTREGPLEDISLSLDTGCTFKGDLVLLGGDFNANVDKADIPLVFNFHFSGRIEGEGFGSGAVEEPGDSGTIYTNLKEVTGAGSMSYTRSSVDQREDRAVEPFIIVGIREDSGVPLSQAEERVVAAMGGREHFWRGNATLPFARVANIQFAGLNLIKGVLVYDRHALDCRAHQIIEDVGYLIRGSELDFITGDSGSDPDDVCTALATGPFAARFAKWRDRIVPYTIILVPCVWDATPHPRTLVEDMIGAINTNAITINGLSRPAFELRMDGIERLRTFVSATGTKHFGYLKLGQLKDGWTDGKLFCARATPVDVAGQTAPSYTAEASVRQMYEYRRTTFSTLATLCPRCHGA